jgi:hypothetical protein
MHRDVLTSTALKSAGYDSATSILEIEFVHGTVYRYFGVPREVYDGLITAESRGAYFDEHVRRAGFAYQRVS